ncbi:hypothetical protein TELCIR_07601 [Teladorsagia circumcincta]|uniref:Uncharacterized protein n=1 Tax=Teladorsagia circumcincta TaxID=45464 RepID=A0A2G9UJX5_TELCI|nr:hypothetical protein TELCIR_07601 [Teladorsagia circumcincta]
MKPKYCEVNWSPPPHLCVPPRKDGLSFADELVAKHIIEATKVHDLILVYHPNIRDQIATIGPQKANVRSATEVDRFQQVGDLPEWYHYKKSSTIPDLVLVAQPGYAIITRDSSKQVAEQSSNEVKAGMSGYNNHYPDMQGVFLAYGPVFRKGYHKGPLELCDIYTLICSILRLEDCHTSCGRSVGAGSGGSACSSSRSCCSADLRSFSVSIF